MLMQLKNKMTKSLTTKDFTMILDSSDVPSTAGVAF